MLGYRAQPLTSQHLQVWRFKMYVLEPPSILATTRCAGALDEMGFSQARSEVLGGQQRQPHLPPVQTTASDELLQGACLESFKLH